MDLALLRTLIALVEERSTVRAARRLFVSQPTVSGSLARLRDIFGDALFVRNGRALEPTARALDLAAAIKPHLDGLAQAIASATPFDPCLDKRVFRFGCTDAVAFALLPALSLRLIKDAPLSDLIVRVGDYRSLPGMLASGEISTALGYLRDDPPASARIRTLRHSPWVVLRDAASPPVSDLDDFCQRSHALVTPSGDLNGFVDEALAALGRSRRVAIGLASFALLLAVLPGGPLIASVPDFVARRLAKLGGLAIDPCPIDVPLVTNRLAWRAATDRDPAEAWFRQAVMDAFTSVE